MYLMPYDFPKLFSIISMRCARFSPLLWAWVTNVNHCDIGELEESPLQDNFADLQKVFLSYIHSIPSYYREVSLYAQVNYFDTD